IPPHAARALPPERLLFVPPRQSEVVRRAPEIERRSAAGALKPIELKLDTPELPPPEAAPREEAVKDRRVTQPRRDAAVPDPGGPENLRLPDLKRPRPADLRPQAADHPRER